MTPWPTGVGPSFTSQSRIAVTSRERAQHSFYYKPAKPHIVCVLKCHAYEPHLAFEKSGCIYRQSPGSSQAHAEQKRPWLPRAMGGGQAVGAGKAPGNLTSPRSSPSSRDCSQPGGNTQSQYQQPKWASQYRRTLAKSKEMVSSNGGSDRICKRRRTCSASPSTEALTPVQQQQTVRHRKQKVMSRLSDSGFGEDLTSPFPSPVRTVASPLRPDEPETPTGELSNWHRHYGDIGYKIQKENEAQFHPCKCLAGQPQVTAEARCKLVSWLIPVHKHFHLSFECCCLAVNIMDRFLASTPVAADCFQLLGITALLLASKQVEVFSPRISQLLSLCCDAFTKEQLCNLECLILLRLNFRLAAPTLAFFLDYYANCGEATQLVACNTGGDRSARDNPDTKRPRHCSNLARRVCELSLADYAFNKYPASLTAGCALRIASELQGLEEPTDQKHPPKFIRSQEDRRSSFVDELCDNKSLAVEGHYLFVVQESHSCSLAQECRENLKLLVSLNHQTLQEMSTM